MFRLFAFFILFSFFGCSKNEPSLSKNLVVVSITPYEFLVKKIAKDTVEIRSLIPETANAHSYEPTPQKVHELTQAKIWFQLGEPLEKNIEPSVRQKNSSLIIYDLANGIDLIDDCCHLHHHRESKDLHIWLNPLLMKKQAVAIAHILMDRFSEHSLFYQKNLESLLLELDTLHLFIENQLQPLEGKTILVTHPAFGYFCREYQCTQISVEFEGKDPLPKQLNKVLALAKEAKVQAVISLPQFSKKSAGVVSKALKIPVYEFNPYLEDYIQNMKDLSNLVVISNE